MNEMDCDNGQRMVPIVNTINPKLKIFLRPIISAKRPKGTRNTADERSKPMATQLREIIFPFSSFPISGRAIFTAEPMKGPTKEANDATKRAAF